MHIKDKFVGIKRYALAFNACAVYTPHKWSFIYFQTSIIQYNFYLFQLQITIWDSSVPTEKFHNYIQRYSAREVESNSKHEIQNQTTVYATW